MIRHIFCAVAMLAFFSFASCKTNKDVANQSTEKMEKPDGVVTPLDKLVETIGITDSTEEKFRKIYTKYQDKRMAVKEEGGKPSQMVKDVLMLRDKQNHDVKKILNDDQYAIYLEAIEDSKGRPAKQPLVQPVK
jgi:hypothetical protein